MVEDELSLIVVLRYIQSSDRSEDSSTLNGFETGREESDSVCPLL